MLCSCARCLWNMLCSVMSLFRRDEYGELFEDYGFLKRVRHSESTRLSPCVNSNRLYPANPKIARLVNKLTSSGGLNITISVERKAWTSRGKKQYINERQNDKEKVAEKTIGDSGVSVSVTGAVCARHIKNTLIHHKLGCKTRSEYLHLCKASFKNPTSKVAKYCDWGYVCMRVFSLRFAW